MQRASVHGQSHALRMRTGQAPSDAKDAAARRHGDARAVVVALAFAPMALALASCSGGGARNTALGPMLDGLGNAGAAGAVDAAASGAAGAMITAPSGAAGTPPATGGSAGTSGASNPPTAGGAGVAAAAGASGALAQAGRGAAGAGASGAGGSVVAGSGGRGGTGGVGGAGGAGAGGSGDSGPQPCRAEPTHMGGLTQYDATALGNCGEPWPADDLYGAMATADYMNSSVCGMCAEVTGPTGMKTVIHAVDQCPVASNPKCVAGHIDLSHTAYNAIVPSNYQFGGEVPNSSPIAWHYVPCQPSGPIVYHFKDGTNSTWLAVQIRNSRYGVASIEWRKNGNPFQKMTARTADLAYFVTNPNSMTFDLRVTDVNGQVLEDDGLHLMPNGDAQGHAQFPSCK